MTPTDLERLARMLRYRQPVPTEIADELAAAVEGYLDDPAIPLEVYLQLPSRGSAYRLSPIEARDQTIRDWAQSRPEKSLSAKAAAIESLLEAMESGTLPRYLGTRDQYFLKVFDDIGVGVIRARQIRRILAH